MSREGPVPNENSVRPVADVIPQGETAKLKQIAACSSLVKKVRRRTHVQGSAVPGQTSNGRTEAAHSKIDWGFFQAARRW